MKNLAVIVPAYNEEVLIEKTINSIPEKVNKIVIINDCSKDDTEKIVKSLMKKNEKIELINFDKNSGVGAALIAGYNYCYEKKYDIAVVMPGDAQALPVDFDKLIEPVVSGKADYAKGNRLKHKNVKEIKTLPRPPATVPPAAVPWRRGPGGPRGPHGGPWGPIGGPRGVFFEFF